MARDYRQALALRYQTMPVSEKRKIFQRIGEIKNTLAVIPP
jgi:hypothetical protein